MSDQITEEIKKKILRERNIIVGASNLKKKTTNAAVIQKCNSNIQEAQQNIDYLNERLNQLKFKETESQNNENSALSTTSPDNPVEKNSNSNETNFSRLDLIKYDCPSLGQRIQYMVNQLDTKLKVEQKYYEANEKLSKIYQLDGDRRISSVAEDGRIQSNHKIRLLKKSVKRYEDINISLDNVEQSEESEDNIKFRRKPLAGTLTVGVSAIRDVDHIASPLFSRKTESFISIKVDDEEKVKTKGSRSDKWNEEFNIHIEKGNEVEITVFDKISGSFVPVAIAWFLISDIAEEIRKKKVGQSGVGWVSASRIQNNTKGPNRSTTDNFTLNDKEDVSSSSKDPIRSSSWFILEPAGQILLTFGFTKSVSPNKKTLLGGLHRHGAIRKRDEEVFEQHGHQFVQKQFYNIMRCALCGDFLPYNGYQCQDCKFLCHKRCYEKVITKCISKSSTDIDPDELKLNHRIPHRFDHFSNRGTNWCCHCGYLLPWSRKNVLKCSECDTMCHVQCSHLVPDFCGMSMETANEILKTIKSTEGTRKKRIEDFKSRQSLSSSTTTLINPTSSALSEKRSTTTPLTGKPSIGTLATQDYDLSSNLPTQLLHNEQVASNQSHPQRRPPPTADGGYPSQHVQEKSSLLPAQSQYLQDFQDDVYEIPADQISPRENNFIEEDYHRSVDPRLAQSSVDNLHYSHDEEQVKHLHNLDESPLHQTIPEEDIQQADYDSYVDQYQPQDVSFQQDAEEQISNRQSQYSQISSKYDTRKSLESGRSQEGSHYQDNSHQEKAAEQAKLRQQHYQQQQQQLQQQQHFTASTDSPISSSRHSGHRERRHRAKVGLDDFNFVAVLGRGNFGKVMLGRSHRTKKLCAVKILKKDMIIDNGEIASMQAEKEVFLIANREKHPFLTNLHCCFQTANRIYFVMEYVSGGDLMWHVQQGNFSLRRAKFYAAEVLLALKYLHENGIVYRDLKLDNIMLNTEGHIKLADYGLCKQDMWYAKTTNTFCGTPEFMAPEILKEQHYTRSVDWWAFGVLVYQMLLGKSPFRGEDEDEVFNAILTDEPLFPIQMASEAVGLLESLLDKNPESRLGSGPRDAEEIMDHPYFRNINFDDILNLKVPPPYTPEVKSEEDISFFDKDFTSEVPRLTPVNSVLDSSTQAQFRGFSYVNDTLDL